MKLARYIEEIPFNKNSVVTVGTFDGVHLAHQKVIETVVLQARKCNGRSVVVTFEPYPREILLDAVETKILTTLQERKTVFENIGVDWLYVIEFNKTFSQQSFREFYIRYLINGIGLSVIVEGYDHHWGRNREGTIDTLIELGKEYKFSVIQLKQFTYDNIPVKSSLIRNEIGNGHIERAAEFLGRPYALNGKVVHGDRRGHLLGYPTANIELESAKKLLPKDGIYFVQVYIDENKYFGMASIGVRPTFYKDGKRTVEVHILNFQRDIYGYQLRMDFLRRLRDELKFDSTEQLVQQMHQDMELSRKLQIDYLSTT